MSILKRQKPKVPKKTVDPNKNSSEKKFEKDEIFSFYDIGNYFLESLIFEDCPLYSLESPPQKFLKTLHLKKSLLFSFSYHEAFKLIEDLSFVGSPISQYPYYRIMALLAFDDIKNQHYQPKIKKIDDNIIQEDEKTLAKKYSCLSDYVKRGGIIRTFDNSLARESIQTLLLTIPLPESSKETKLTSLLFSRFFNTKNIQSIVENTSKKISPFSLSKCINDYQIQLRKFYTELDHILSNPRFIETQQTVSSLSRRIEEMNSIISKYIERIERNSDKNIFLKDGKTFCTISRSLIDKYSHVNSKLNNFIQSAISTYQQLITEVNSSQLDSYFHDYLAGLSEFINFCTNLTSSTDFSIDLLFSSIQQIMEFDSKFSNFQSPYCVIFDKLYNLSSELKDTSQQSHNLTASIETLNNFIKFCKISPVFCRFDQILKRVSSIPTNSYTQQITTLCQAASNKKLYTLFISQTTIKSICSYIRDARKSILLEILGFWKKHNATCAYPILPKVDENINKRSEQMARSIHNFHEVINNTCIVDCYVKDRTYDAVLKMKRNEFLQNLIKSKKNEIKRKDQQIEHLRQLIQNQTKMSS